MKKINLLKCLSALVLISGALTMTGCGSNPDTPKSDTPTSQTQTDNGSVIKSVKAKQAEAELRVGDTKNIKDYYDITSSSGAKLTTAQQKCTYTSSDTTVIKFQGTSSMKAMKVGEATVTVTSNIDPTKSCSFKVVVKDVYFDRNLSLIDAADDFSKEHPSEGGEVRTQSSSTTDLFVKGIEATKLYAEVTFSFHSVLASELYPKAGIFVSTGLNTTPENNRLYFFLDAVTSGGNTKWTNFGVCEVESGGNWAWNPGVTNTTARHNDNCWSSPTPYTFESEVSVGLLRDGLDFHMFVDGQYKFSITTLETLFKNDASEDAATSVGFFEFNSDVTFKEYANTTADPDVVQAKLDSITTKNFVTNWADD